MEVVFRHLLESWHYDEGTKITTDDFILKTGITVL
jgi:hypothetical protein